MVFVGSDPEGERRYAGLLQDVRLYRAALDRAQIHELHAQPAKADLRNVSGYLRYRQDERAKSFVVEVRDDEEALSAANDTEFGLSAGICTTSLKHASHFRADAEAGMVMVSLPTAGVDYHVPFGGRKGSSYGAREFHTTVKTSYTLP